MLKGATLKVAHDDALLIKTSLQALSMIMAPANFDMLPALIQARINAMISRTQIGNVNRVENYVATVVKEANS